MTKCNQLTPLPFKQLIHWILYLLLMLDFNYFYFFLTYYYMTSRCLAVTGGGNIAEGGRLSHPAGFWAHYNIL